MQSLSTSEVTGLVISSHDFLLQLLKELTQEDIGIKDSEEYLSGFVDTQVSKKRKTCQVNECEKNKNIWHMLQMQEILYMVNIHKLHWERHCVYYVSE